MSDQLPLSGMSVVVTGAGSGIGRAIAEGVAAAGARVTAVGRRPGPLAELVEKAAGEVRAVAADVAAPGAAERIVQAALDAYGRLDGVVNNAGLARFGPLEETGPQMFEDVLRVNAVAPAELVRCALPHLRRTRGSVVNISSVGGSLAMPGRSFYGASKAALNSLTRSLAKELAPDVRVNAVLPGPVDTPMWYETGLSEDGIKELARDLTASTPLGRFGQGEDVARWVCALLDPVMSGWVTGALVPVDGGRTA
jgi:NAD(P)-dependent dehydrogenase (short-subunit alcohol dehydrogenase family)